MSCSRLGIPARDGSSTLHRRRLVAVDVDGDREDPVGLGKCCVNVPERHLAAEVHVVAELLEHQWLCWIEGVVVGHDRFEHLDVLYDQLERVLRHIPALRHDHGDGVADVADLVGGEGVKPWQLHSRKGRCPRRHSGLSRTGQALHVLARVDGEDPRKPAGLGDIQRVKQAMGHLAAKEGRVQHFGQHQVVDIAAPAGKDPGVLHPHDARTHGTSPHDAHCSGLLKIGSRGQRSLGQRAPCPPRSCVPSPPTVVLLSPWCQRFGDHLGPSSVAPGAFRDILCSGIRDNRLLRYQPFARPVGHEEGFDCMRRQDTTWGSRTQREKP